MNTKAYRSALEAKKTLLKVKQLLVTKGKGGMINRQIVSTIQEIDNLIVESMPSSLIKK